MRTVCILGASGLVGATLHDRLAHSGGYELRPVVHTPGGAWRLTRQGIPLVQADLLDTESLDRAVAGADIVVNCAKIVPEPHLVEATRNLVDACARHAVERLVHLSSVAVYGESPSPESARETAAPAAERRSYGYYKAKQDEIIEEACRQDKLKAVTLCIPNVSGAYSDYLLFLLGGLGAGRLALVDEGRLPVMLADVRNVVAAIELAFETDHLDGTRTHVMDGDPTTWADLMERLEPLARRDHPLPRISLNEAQALLEQGPKGVRGALGTARRIAGEPSVKKIIKDNTSLTRNLLRWRTRLQALPDGPRNSVLGALRGGGVGKSRSASTGRGPEGAGYDPRFVRHQLRRVRHLNDKARETLGYEPPVSFDDSMSAFANWYEILYGFRGPSAALLAELERERWEP